MPLLVQLDRWRSSLYKTFTCTLKERTIGFATEIWMGMLRLVSTSVGLLVRGDDCCWFGAE